LSAAVSSTGKLYVWGEGFEQFPVLAEIDGHVVDVSLGEKFIIALLSDGRLFSWGNN
jgi:alpha-tubulin suppressor-like RCC1 family protein